jgi:NAD(P)-dependent dehydrogenase (short-subunit alcohol dehydrogenase family)
MAQNETFTAADIPDLTGKTIIITGSNSGLGFECARALTAKRAHVVLACRNLGKAAVAVEQIKGASATSSVEAMALDLADLSSVRSFVAAFCDKFDRLDVLLNNAGVMAIPRTLTKDGFEMQLGTNHLGHFALTGLLLKRLLNTPGARVVTVTSLMHKAGKIAFDDLQGEKRYNAWAAYNQSKLANLLFTYELQRRFEQRKIEVIAVASHPGYSSTNLQLVGPRLTGSAMGLGFMNFSNKFFAQSAAMGALPSLFAATSGHVRGGDCIGPKGPGEIWGYPTKVRTSARSYDMNVAARLFELSETLTNVRYDTLLSKSSP